MSNPVLKLENVTMQFGGVVAVDNLSMEVGEGEIVALIGPNGAGKTTAFNVVTGVYAPTNGCLYLDGRPYLCEHPTGRAKHDYLGSDVEKFAGKPTLRKTPDQITKMGLARTFQNIRLFGNLTVFENVLIAKHMHAKGGFLAATFHLNGKEETRMRREAMELLEIVGLAELKDETASNLPYGQQRRLEIARALAGDLIDAHFQALAAGQLDLHGKVAAAGKDAADEPCRVGFKGDHLLLRAGTGRLGAGEVDGGLEQIRLALRVLADDDVDRGIEGHALVRVVAEMLQRDGFKSHIRR